MKNLKDGNRIIVNINDPKLKIGVLHARICVHIFNQVKKELDMNNDIESIKYRGIDIKLYKI